MSYLLSWNGKKINASNTELKHHDNDDVELYVKNIQPSLCKELVEAYKKGAIDSWLSAYEKSYFFCVLHDKQKKKLYVVNDHSASNNTLHFIHDSVVYITDDIFAFREKTGVVPEIDKQSAYEFLAYFAVVPPKTIYRNIYAIPLGSYVEYDSCGSVPSPKRYWYPEKLLAQKEFSYELLVQNVTEGLSKAVSETEVKGLGVSLSSGVDSGGLLSMITKLTGTSVPSITMGPYGSDYHEVKIAQRVARYNNSDNHLIVPHVGDVARLLDYAKGINQPIEVTSMMGYGMLLEKAGEIGLKQCVFGLGAEMLMGNLKIMKMAYTMSRVESIMPFSLLRHIYKAAAFYKNFSSNQKAFLQEPSWIERFLYARGPLFNRERKMYPLIKDSFIDHFKDDLEGLFDTEGVGLLDKLVLSYLFSWVFYMQMRDLMALGSRYRITPVVPFDHPTAMRASFSATDQARRRGKWDKQIIRDVFRPYVTEEMYKARPGSLIIPYDTWLLPYAGECIDYLKHSKIVSSIVDLEKYEKEYRTLPEPGLHLMRLINLAFWYDVNWETAGSEKARTLVGKFLTT